ncbi:hypothetical protein B0J17DRAFT_767616 [Rhizoctonia solani]|nr:hypothetical protein B0J17DRAFT_767616 [Rhizoctonia solani]
MVKMVRNLDPNPTWAESPIVEWAKGLHERKILQLELAKPPNRPTPVVVATLAVSLYRILPPIKPSNTSGGTLESITPSDPVARPLVSIAFKPPYDLDLLDLLHICYSVRVDSGQITPIEDWPWFFGLVVLLCAVRQALPTQSPAPSTSPSPMDAQPPLRLLWNDAYELARLHEHAFWKGSLLQRTESFVREVIREAAYEALAPDLEPDWQIASCMAWNAAWNTAVKYGKDAVTTNSSTPAPVQAPAQPQQRSIDEKSRDEQTYQERKEEAHGKASSEIKSDARKTSASKVSRIAGVVGVVRSPAVNKTNYNPDIIAQLANSAWNRATESLRQQSGRADQLTEQEWRNMLNKGLVLQHLAKDGRWLRPWKRDSSDIFEEAWKAAWTSAWKTTWDDAYNSTVSRGIYFGIETALEAQNANHHDLHVRHKQLVAHLQTHGSYNLIKSKIDQGQIRDRLKFIQSLVKDLYHLTDQLQYTADTTHGACVIVCALISAKTPTLDGIVKKPLNWGRLEDLSYDYFQLRTFIMENYVSKFSDGDQPKFSKSADLAWKLFMDANNGRPI